MFSFCLHTLLCSTNLVVGLVQNLHVAYPRDGHAWWWETVYLYLNHESVVLFGGCKTENATGRQWGCLFNRYTAEQRHDLFSCSLWVLRAPLSPVELRAAETVHWGSWELPSTSDFTFTMTVMLRPQFLSFPLKIKVHLFDNVSFCLQISYIIHPCKENTEAGVRSQLWSCELQHFALRSLLPMATRWQQKPNRFPRSKPVR